MFVILFAMAVILWLAGSLYTFLVIDKRGTLLGLDYGIPFMVAFIIFLTWWPVKLADHLAKGK